MFSWIFDTDYYLCVKVILIFIFILKLSSFLGCLHFWVCLHIWGCLHFWGHLHFEVQVCHSSDEPSIICHIFLIIRYDGFVALIPLNDIFNEWCNNSKRQDREIDRRQRSWHSDHSCTLCSCGKKRQIMPRDNYNSIC